jgi:hypothetical protein
MSQPFLGVNLDEKLSSTDSAPEVSPGGGATDKAPEVGNTGTPEKPESDNLDKPSPDAKPELVDLDKLEKFRWKGRELTLKELESDRLRHEDYTRKVSQVAEIRKYSENFEYDLEKVVANPALLGEMRKVYPAQFVKIAESVLNRLPSKRDDEPQRPNEFDTANTFETEKITGLEQQLQTALKQIEELTGWKSGIDQRVQEANLAKTEAQLDKWFDDFGKKYPEADPEIVNAKAAYLSEQLEASGKRFSQGDLEKLFKSEHERIEKRYAERYRTQIEKQKAAADRGQDMGAGGGVPSTPPSKARNIKEATKHLLDDIESGRVR